MSVDQEIKFGEEHRDRKTETETEREETEQELWKHLEARTLLKPKT